jgi:ferredoxin-NADP reductase
LLFEIEVEKLVQRTESALSIRFSKPNGFDYLAGQYMFITVGVGDAEVTKHLTISSRPTENFLEVTKRLTGHPFANALASLRPGDIVKLRFAVGFEYRDFR